MIDPTIVGIAIPLSALALGGIMIPTIIKAVYRDKELKIRAMEAEAQLYGGRDRETVEQLRQEVAELRERVEFTERMLGQGREQEKLGKGS